MEPLVHRCGGVLVLHEGFGAHFAYDLQAAPRRVAAAHGVVDCFLSPALAVDRIVGPTEPLPAGYNAGAVTGAAAATTLAGPAHTPNACLMRTMEPMDALTVALKLVNQLPGQYAYVQLTATFTPVGAGVEAEAVTRVLTHRLRVTDQPQRYIAATRPATAAAVAAKLTVLALARTTSDAPSLRAEQAARQQAQHTVRPASIPWIWSCRSGGLYVVAAVCLGFCSLSKPWAGLILTREQVRQWKRLRSCL
jgi:hypothetical protein